MKNKIMRFLTLLFAVSLSLFGCGEKNISDYDTSFGIPMPKPGSGTMYENTQKTTENATQNDINAEKTETSVPEIEASTYERVSFIGCGDNIIYFGNTRDAESLSDGSRKYNFKPMFAPVADRIQSADIAFINQETVMAGDGYDISYYPRFNSPRDLGYDLVELGYDVINIANNHMLDKGADGLSRTIDFWNEQPVLMIGGYKDSTDYDTIRIMEKNGIRIAFLSYTYFTNGLSKPASSPLAIPYTNDEDMIRQCAMALSEAEFLIVSVHWGDEGVFRPNTEQKRIAKLLSDCGADVIIGHHPHVIQPIEWLYGKNGNKTLCVYSLGNFAAEQAHAYNMAGGMIEFDIVSENNGKPRVENPVFIPTVFHFDSRFYHNTVYPLSEYTTELANAHGVSTYYGNAFSMNMLKKYVDDCIAEEFLNNEP